MISTGLRLKSLISVEAVKGINQRFVFLTYLMKSKLSEFKERYPFRDFVEDPLDIADSLLILVSFLVLVGLTRTSFIIGGAAPVLISWAGYLLAFSGLILVISDFDKEKYTKLLAVGFLIVIMLSNVAGGSIRTEVGSDVDTFAIYSAELVLNGENPYEESMLPSVDMFEQLDESTPLIDGGNVASQSYPAPSFLYLVPQVALGFENIFLTSSIFLALTILILMIDVQPQYRMLSVIGFYFLFDAANFSPMEYIWMSMLMLGIRFWNPRRYLSLFFLGLAFSFKQIPWFTAPFLMIWIAKENDTLHQGVTEIIKQFGFLGTVFIIPNIPFIIDSPIEWLQGVFTPMSSAGTLVQMGEGFIQLSLSLGYMPQSFFKMVMVIFTLSLLAIYWLYFEEIKWIAWITPALILWFNYRSAPKYMVPFIPVFVYVYLVKNDLTSNYEWREAIPFVR